MADAIIQVPPDSTGKKIAAKSVIESGNTVLRQEVCLADPLVADNVLQVFAEDAAHTSGDKGIVTFAVRQDAESSPVSASGDYTALITDNVGRQKVNAKPMTPTTATYNSAGNTNLTSVAAGARTLYGLVATNINAAIRYVKIYDKATAPVLASDVPKLTIAIPLTGSRDINFGALGMQFALGIAFAMTTGATDTDTGAVAANEIKLALNYV